jgi:hypothetical protein
MRTLIVTRNVMKDECFMPGALLPVLGERHSYDPTVLLHTSPSAHSVEDNEHSSISLHGRVSVPSPDFS